ncbi:MAG: dinitrogenase iron-molybdenum cofactor biosynthesis protein [Lachnospiraceae bacterium]|nr:dinitrogenase iron-molybdenum cofactor biosynthesis protein [Lachnospiraceae bacterium]
MDNEKYLIAVASSDGIVVNSHFGRASKFYVYEVSDGDKVSLLEQRNVIPVCEGGNHDSDRLKENLLTFGDCKYMLVSRIGIGAASVAESIGIKVYENSGMIEESISRLVKYLQVQKLF